jgi:hypothetical protein
MRDDVKNRVAQDPTSFLLSLEDIELKTSLMKALSANFRVGEVSIQHKGQYTQLDKLEKIDQKTHAVYNSRSKIICENNLFCGLIHPVSDKCFWSRRWGESDRFDKVKEGIKMLSDQGKESMKMGYRWYREAHLRQLLMHNVGGSIIFYFRCVEISGMPSAVRMGVFQSEHEFECDSEPEDEREGELDENESSMDIE